MFKWNREKKRTGVIGKPINTYKISSAPYGNWKSNCPFYIVWLLFTALCVYNVVDVHQTALLLKVGAVESNPIIQWFIDIVGSPLIGILIPKVLLFTTLMITLIILSRRR